MPHPETPETTIKRTRRWIETFVIGLNLCPFAKPVYDADRIRYVVSAATDAQARNIRTMQALGVERVRAITRLHFSHARL